MLKEKKMRWFEEQKLQNWIGNELIIQKSFKLNLFGAYIEFNYIQSWCLISWMFKIKAFSENDIKFTLLLQFY